MCMKAMTKKKQLWILAAVFLILTAAYVGIGTYQDWNDQKEKEERAKALEVTDLNSDRVFAIAYTDSSEETMRFSKEGDTWYYEGDRELPLKQSCAEDAVDEFSSLKAVRRLTGTEESSAYGFDDPSYKVRLTDQDGKETDILIGDVSDSADSDYYITADGGKTIFTIRGSILDCLIFDEASLIQTETFPDINSTNLKKITIKKAGKVLDSCEAKGEKESEADGDLTTYGSELSGISLDTCVSYNANSRQLKTCGLNQKSRREVTAVYEDADSGKQKTQVFYLGKVFEEDGSDCVYVQMKGSKQIYQIDVSDTEKLISIN